MGLPQEIWILIFNSLVVSAILINCLKSLQRSFLNIIFSYLHLSQWKEGFHHHIYSRNNSTFQMFQKIHIPEPLCRFSVPYSWLSHHSQLYLCRLCWQQQQKKVIFHLLYTSRYSVFIQEQNKYLNRPGPVFMVSYLES